MLDSIIFRIGSTWYSVFSVDVDKNVITYRVAPSVSNNELNDLFLVAWDGGDHAFILDSTVHPDVRRNGIGLNLVKQAVAIAQGKGIEWLHVDYEPHLRGFYQRCGFQPTEAGLMAL